jgi:signal peptidase II
MNLNKKKMVALFLVIIFFIVLDRFFKFLAIHLYFNSGINILGDFFKLNFAANYNIAFSLPLSGLFLNIVIAFIILALIYNLIYAAFKKQHIQAVFLLAVILGAASNLLDRLKYGYVVDYLDLKYFTVFNLADVMIVFGVIGLGWIMIDKKKNLL